MAAEEGVEHLLQEVRAAADEPGVVHMGEAERRTIERYVPGFLSEPAPFYLRRELERGPDEALHECVFDLERDGYLGQHLVRGQPSLSGSFVVVIATETAETLDARRHVTTPDDIAFLHYLSS